MGVNDYFQIGSRIKQLRKNSGMTQREVAKKLELPFSTYSNYENNNREPSFDILQKISKVLNVSFSHLVAEEELADTEHLKFQKLQNYLEEIEVALEHDENDEEFGRYQLTTFENGTIATMSKGELLELYERIEIDAENYIIRRLRAEFFGDKN